MTTLCNCFASNHPQDFEKVLWLYDDLKPCFSRYSDQLRIPEKIRKTNIYVETKLPPDEIVKTVGDLLTEFIIDIVNDINERLRIREAGVDERTVTDALARFDQGTYGTCESCREQLDPARLSALPYATLCIRCQQRLEA